MRTAITKYPFQHHLLPLFGLRRGTTLPREGHPPIQAPNGRVYFIASIDSLPPTKSRKPHRLFGECFYCAGYFPAGRLIQHEPACKESVK